MPPSKIFQNTYKQKWGVMPLAVLLILSTSSYGGMGAGLNVIIADTSSSFARPDPSDPKYIVTLSAAATAAFKAASSNEEDSDRGEFAGSSSSETPDDDVTAGTQPPGGSGAGTRVRMTAANGQSYWCVLPNSDTGENALALAEELQRQQAAGFPNQKSPFELLEAMSSLCLYRQEGLWTYEVCYKRHARQFRQDTAGSEDFSCGKYTGDEQQEYDIKSDNSSNPYPIRYVSHVFQNGGKCALTGGPRSAEVRFTCLPEITDNAIVTIREFPTCNYVFVLSTPFLCKHPAFQQAPEQHLDIRCEPVRHVLEENV